jgi:3-oxoadipate enol-lactonase
MNPRAGVPGISGDTCTEAMPEAELSNATLHYELREAAAGAGPCRLLVIGGTDSDLRRPPSPFDWPGADGFSILAYDHRDLGRSRSLDGAQPSMADFAADALELAEHVGWDSFAVLGISFGGMVAEELALLAPERVERLVLVVTSGGGSLGSSFPLHETYALEPQERVERMVHLLDTRTGESAELATALRAFLTAAGDAPPSPGLLRQLEARRGHDVSSRIGALAMPCLIVAGRYDGLAPPDRSTRLAEAIPGARVEILDGGHGVLLQDPMAWPLIASFLAEAR